jgi:hypothetical protein
MHACIDVCVLYTTMHACIDVCVRPSLYDYPDIFQQVVVYTPSALSPKTPPLDTLRKRGELNRGVWTWTKDCIAKVSLGKGVGK